MNPVPKRRLYRMEHLQPIDQAEPLLIAGSQEASEALSRRHPQRVVLGVDWGGQRSYLGGEPLSSGTSVEIQIGGMWIPARVETSSILLNQDEATAVAQHTYVPVIHVEGNAGPVLIPGCGLPVRRAGTS